jgi:hypothetical protein
MTVDGRELLAEKVKNHFLFVQSNSVTVDTIPVTLEMIALNLDIHSHSSRLLNRRYFEER